MRNSRNARMRAQLARDQNGRCFYCHLQLRDDNTLEHLLSRSHGGGDNYGNLRASHAKCNSAVGNLPVAEKLRLAKIGEIEGSDAFFLEIAKIDGKRTSAARAKAEKRRLKQMRRKWARRIETTATAEEARTGALWRSLTRLSRACS